MSQSEEIEESFATYCPDCQAQFYEGEDGHGWEECLECGGSDCYEIPG